MYSSLPNSEPQNSIPRSGSNETSLISPSASQVGQCLGIRKLRNLGDSLNVLFL